MVSYCCFDLHFLMIYDEQHLFMCLFAICIFSSVRYLSLKGFAPFFNQVVLLLWSLKGLCICWIAVVYQMYLLQTFSSSMWLLLFSYIVFYRTDILILIKFSLSIISFMDHGSFVLHQKRHHHSQGHLCFPFCHLLGVLQFVFHI